MTTSPGPRDPNPRALEATLARLLSRAVIAAAAIIAIGLIALLAVRGDEPVDLRTFAPAPERTLAGVLDHALALEPRSIVQLGVLLLVLTPALRVAAALWVFAREKDRLYAALSAAVLAMLLLSALGIAR